MVWFDRQNPEPLPALARKPPASEKAVVVVEKIACA
jgi:hypothetical protein